MIFVLEIFSLCLIAVLCCLCTITDLKSGVIHNKLLFVFLISSVVVDVIYYGIYARDYLHTFILNLGMVLAVSLLLFYTHSFAGGDCKMLIVIAMLFPARLCWDIESTASTLVFVIPYSIFAGYCYMVGYSIFSIAKKKTQITFDYVKKQLKNFIRSYLVAMVYISLLNSVFTLFFKYGISINMWVARILCLAIVLIVGRYQVFRQWFLIIPSICISLVISSITLSFPVSLNIEYYVLTLILLICQITANTTIYEKISVECLKRGMILSAMSSLAMQTSITAGLPGVSTEDLKSRLSDEEIEIIKIWARTTHIETLTVVKKIPFAIFISVGICLYCATWGLLL